MQARPLRELRETKGYSKMALARMVEASPNTIEYLEKNERSAKGATMAKIAAVLGCEVLEVAEFAETLRIGPRRESPELSGEDMYQLYESDAELRRFVNERYARRTVSSAEVA